MSKLIFAALAISAAAENAESAAVKAIDALKVEAADATTKASKLEKENTELKTKVEAAETEVKKTLKARADSLVKAAVADGRIAPKDEDKQSKFREKIAAGDTFAEEILAELPNVKHEARLTGSACSMQEAGWNWGESFGLGAGQPLLSMRLLCFFAFLNASARLLFAD